MTPEELTALCRALQAEMRLLDWRIEIKYAGPRQLKKNFYAKVDWAADQESAVILIRHPDSVKRAKLKAYDIGHSVTHELIHLKLEGHKEEDESLHTSGYEAGVDHLAELVWNGFKARKVNE